jgi:hypothetical protein
MGMAVEKIDDLNRQRIDEDRLVPERFLQHDPDSFGE